MIVLGFDPSKCTGWAVFNSALHISATECGVFEMPPKADHYYTGDQIARRTTELIRRIGRGNIDLAVLEEQSLARIGNSSADGMIYAWVSTTAIISILANFGIPYVSIPPGSWRKMFFGAGFKPPVDKKGKNDWKAAAVAQCEREGIILPSKKTVAHNAAEACAVAICWRSGKIHARRYESPFVQLLQNRMVAA